MTNKLTLVDTVRTYSCFDEEYPHWVPF